VISRDNVAVCCKEVHVLIVVVDANLGFYDMDSVSVTR